MAAEGTLGGPPEGAAPDWTIDQGWDRYTAEEHQTWLTLYDRQAEVLPGRAADSFIHGLDALDLRGEGVPDFRRISERLRKLTGWSVVAVPGLVPDDVFFDHLANRASRRATSSAARPARLSAGARRLPRRLRHVPMLTDPVFADYMAAYGKGGLRAMGSGQLHNLARLYWYTVEFGLMNTAEGLRSTAPGSSHPRRRASSPLRTPPPTGWASTWSG
jgi:phenylalanine-4-hydroxylase